MLCEIAAAAIARRGDSGDLEWLVALRREGDSLAGFWEWPGGKVEPGESHPQAASRELREEVGLDIPPERLVDTGATASTPRVRLHLLWCLVDGDAQPRAIECAQVRWVQTADLQRLRFPAANAPLTAAIVALAGRVRS